MYGGAAQLGDQLWRDLLDRHDQAVPPQFKRFRDASMGLAMVLWPSSIAPDTRSRAPSPFETL